MRLKPRSERKLNANQIIQELRPKFAQIPGINVYLQNPPLIRVGGMLTKALYQFSLQDTDTKELYHWSPILMNKIAAITNVFQDVTSDLLIANPHRRPALVGVADVHKNAGIFDGVSLRSSIPSPI